MCMTLYLPSLVNLPELNRESSTIMALCKDKALSLKALSLNTITKLIFYLPNTLQWRKIST